MIHTTERFTATGYEAGLREGYRLAKQDHERTHQLLLIEYAASELLRALELDNDVELVYVAKQALMREMTRNVSRETLGDEG